VEPSPGQARVSPTLYDVAREAGVSTATVSRVVHGQGSVRPATTRRVLEVIEALGYVPDGAAQSMARRRKEVIGLVPIQARSPDTDVERMGLVFTEEVLRGVESALLPLGWPILLAGPRPAGQGDAYQWLQRMSAKVDGLLITEGFEPAGRLARLAARVPVVLIAGATDVPGIDVVATDNRAGMRELVSHLIKVHGRSRLWYVDGPPDAPDARERRGAFLDALGRHPGARLAGGSAGRFAALSGQHAVREILAAPERPDAVVCANDQTAIGAIRELRAAGTRVPEDMSVTGFDDAYLGALLSPPLTTVHQPMRRLGERACSLLLDRIADPGLPHVTERLSATLVVRESCGCPSVV
jgi:LacI family transcriptional regulator